MGVGQPVHRSLSTGPPRGEIGLSLRRSEAIADCLKDFLNSRVRHTQELRCDRLFRLFDRQVCCPGIRKIHELNWNVKHLISYAAVAAVSTTQPSETSKGQQFITSAFLKDPTDPGAGDDPGVKEYLEWAKAYYPSANSNEFLIRFGYASAQTLVEVLKKCDGDFSRGNVMKQALSLNTPLPMLIDSIKLQTAPDQHVPIRQLQLRKFDGEKWQPSGDIVSAD
jgi:branched-chain amino acid transport system substrate-binding protein